MHPAHRIAWLLVGIIVGVVVLAPLAAYLIAKSGGITMATTAKPLPFEKTIAHAALDASVADSAKRQDPLDANPTNLLAGVKVYSQNCAICHGLPGQPKSAIASGEFPPPPQLFEPNQMVTDDPEGVTYWKVSNGIRLSGMPGFMATLSDPQRWQVTMLLSHAGQLPDAVKSALPKTLAQACPPAEQP